MPFLRYSRKQTSQRFENQRDTKISRENKEMEKKIRIIRKIPSELETFKEFSRRNYSRQGIKGYYLYEPSKGRKILVSGWYRWPQYDFIFGVPYPTNPVFKDEWGYLEIRRKIGKKRRYHGWYLDKDELDCFIKGILSLNGRKEEIINL